MKVRPLAGAPSDIGNFSHLSLKDLIEARDTFHAHLINKKNVVATAIGRYRIRITDIDANGVYNPNPVKMERTLENSIVAGFSWPCILVFVEEWEDKEDLVRSNNNDLVPKTIYMPDGRKVPVCVVKASRSAANAADINLKDLTFPTNVMGGGFPLIMHTQGVDRVATVGCLVSDGHKYYALTNQHVCGDGGEEVFSIMGDKQVRIGVSAGKNLRKKKFNDLYPTWDSKNITVSCDVGLVEIDDVTRWTTNVLGVGEMGELYDLNTLNLTLDITTEHELDEKRRKKTITGRVFGYGARSGNFQGEVVALFYRYKAVGGNEYVSDFLIGGMDGAALPIGHADSGTVLHLETMERDKVVLKPFAIHWGQHEFIENNSREAYTYSMATCLSNVCRELDVELVRGWTDEYSWGKVGHYAIGNLVVNAISDTKTFSNLKRLMTNNVERISFAYDRITADIDSKTSKSLYKNPDEGFCPLADVPDVIWKQSPYTTTWGRKGAENPNHYADVDELTNNGQNLFQRCSTVQQLTTAVWIKYYDDVDKAKGITTADKSKRGLISFRVWQIFNYMAKAAAGGDADKFVFAGGVLAHYVGDSCQPLHSSFMNDGDPADDKVIDYTAKRTSMKRDGSISHNKGDVYKKKVNPGSGVHVAYEDHMINDYIGDVKPAIRDILNNASEANKLRPVTDIAGDNTPGQAAGFAVLELMQRTQGDIKPKEIVEAFKRAKGEGLNISETLYDIFGERTTTCMARGCVFLAAIWEAAWTVGKGEAKVKNLSKVTEKDLVALYEDRNELPSMRLTEIDQVLKPGAAAAIPKANANAVRVKNVKKIKRQPALR